MKQLGQNVNDAQLCMSLVVKVKSSAAKNNYCLGHEFEQTPGDNEGQGSLACCSPWGHKELDTT